MAGNVTDSLYGVTPGKTAPGKAVILAQNQEIDSLIQSQEMTFTELTAITSYTADLVLPAGAYIIDVIVHAVALWDSATSASLDVGDIADPNGFFTAIDLKATDLLAAESIGLGYTGGQEGADWDGGEAAGDHVRRRYLAAARTIRGVVTKVGAGTLGRTRVLVVYVVPSRTVAGS